MTPFFPLVTKPWLRNLTKPARRPFLPQECSYVSLV
jgi:hypothetical protein